MAQKCPAHSPSRFRAFGAAEKLIQPSRIGDSTMKRLRDESLHQLPLRGSKA